MKIVQLCAAVYVGDGVGKDILTKAEIIEELGYTCEIYSDDVSPELKSMVRPISELQVDEEDILFHHYSGYTHLVDFVRGLRCKKVLVYHNITPPELVAPEMQAACIMSYQQLPTLKMVYDEYLPVSEYNLRDLIKYGVTQKGDVLPIEVSFGVKHDVQIPYEEKIKEPVRILFVGRVVKNKMQENLLSIFDYYYQYYNKNSHLYLVGSCTSSPEYYRYIEKQRKTLKSKDNIHIVGKVSDEELEKHYKKAHVYVSMSRHEGFGIPLLEAMHYQLPVFAYDAAAVADTLGKAGVLLHTDEPAQIAEQIDEILKDKNRYNEIIKKQNERLKELSRDTIKAKLGALIVKWSKEQFDSVEEAALYKSWMNVINSEQHHENIQAEEMSTLGASQPTGAPIEHYIWKMDTTRENFAFRYIYSCRKVIGGAIVFGKRVVRKLLKWYIEPICFQQTDFNNAATEAVKTLSNQIQTQKQHTQDSINDIEALTNSVKDSVSELGNEIDSIQSNHINEIQRIADKSDEIENRLSQRNDELASQLQYMSSRVEAMERYIKKIDELNLAVFDDDPMLFLERDKTSQSGEDAIVTMAVRTMGISLENVTYLDIGANHAKFLSNTYFFYRNGARGVLVEANPNLIPELKFYRHGDVILNKCVSVSGDESCPFYVLNGDGLSTVNEDSVKHALEENPAIKLEQVVEVPTITVNEILEQFFPTAPVMLSIDVEGIELEILQSIDFEQHRPLFVIVEMIPYRANKIVLEEKNQDVLAFMKKIGYVEFAFTGINSIFVDKQQVEKIQGV